MSEITSSEVALKEVNGSNYRDIKPQTELSVDEAKEYLSNLWKEKQSEVSDDGHYNSYEERIKHTLKKDTELGTYEGTRGESKYIPSDQTDAGKRVREKLSEYGINGIEYRNAEPDFSKCADTVVEIEGMNDNRASNYMKADVECAAQWNSEKREGRTDWTAREVAEFRHTMNYSWHERCDRKTMDLVPYEIHSYFRHSGGVSECRARDNVGGLFDE